MAVPDLTGIAQAAATVLDDAAITVDGRALKTYSTEPARPETLPAAWVRFDSFRRPGAGQRETELGRMDWWLYYEVGVAVALTEAERGQTNMTTVLGTVLNAFDQAPRLNRVDVSEARIIDGTQGFSTINEIQSVQVLCRLEVWALSSPAT